MTDTFKLRSNDYIDDNGHKDIELMEFDYLQGNNGFKKHELSDVLKEMGFPEHSFMVVRESDNPVKVADSYDQYGSLKENPYMTFGGYHKKPEQVLNGYEVNTAYMNEFYSKNGQVPNGAVGSNNGIYAAQANFGHEIIITKDPRIAEALTKELSFVKDALGVPLSNGGVIMDTRRREEWQKVCLWGENVQKHIREGDKDKLPEPKRLNVSEKYEEVKAFQNRIMQSKMNAGRY